MKKLMLILGLVLSLTIADMAASLDLVRKSGLNIFQAISEGQFAKDQNSYTKKLIEGLSGKGDLNNDGEVGLKELQLFFEVDGLNSKSFLAGQTPLSFIKSNFILFRESDIKQLVLATGKTAFINIAIDEYKDAQLTNLKFAVEDAKQLRTVLEQMDLSKKMTTVELINEKATRKNILDSINEMLKKNNLETIIIYLSGHSTDTVFVPYDMDMKSPNETGISTDTFLETLKQSRANIWLISDTCMLWESTVSKSHNSSFSKMR
jgi:hypothetical protein